MKKRWFIPLFLVLFLAVPARNTEAAERSKYIMQTATDILEMLGSEDGVEFDHVADIISDVILIFGSDYVDEEVVEVVTESAKNIVDIIGAEDKGKAVMEQVLSAMMDAVTDTMGEDYGSLTIPFEEKGYHVNIKFDPTDLIVRNDKLILCDEESGIDEYHVVFFGNDTKCLKGIMIEIQLSVSQGYTLEGVKSIDMDEIYPGISTMDFATTEYYDDGDVISLVTCFYDLDESDHLRLMKENELLDVEDYSMAADAQSYIDSLISLGYTEDFYTTKIRHFTTAVTID